MPDRVVSSRASAAGVIMQRLVQTRKRAKRSFLNPCCFIQEHSRSVVRSLPAAATPPPEPKAAQPAKRTMPAIPLRLPRRASVRSRSAERCPYSAADSRMHLRRRAAPTGQARKEHFARHSRPGPAKSGPAAMETSSEKVGALFWNSAYKTAASTAMARLERARLIVRIKILW